MLIRNFNRKLQITKHNWSEKGCISYQENPEISVGIIELWKPDMPMQLNL